MIPLNQITSTASVSSADVEDGAAAQTVATTHPLNDPHNAASIALGMPADTLAHAANATPEVVVDRSAQVLPRMQDLAEAQLNAAENEEAQLSRTDRNTARHVQDTLSQIIFGSSPTAAQNAPAEFRELATQITQDLKQVANDRSRQGLPAPNEAERQMQAANSISRWIHEHNPFRNEQSGTAQRLLGNVLSVGARAGLNTFVGTMVRNITSYSMQQVINAANAAAASMTTPAANSTLGAATTSMPGAWSTAANATGAATNSTLGAAASSIPPGIWSAGQAANLLNGVGTAMQLLMVGSHLLGAIRDFRTGAATTESTMLRFTNAAMALAFTGVGAAQGNWNPLATWYGAIGVYSAIRGVGSALVPYRDNLTGVSGPGLALATAAYTGAQFAGNMAQSSAGWSAGATAQNIRTSGNSAQSIADAQHPWGANIGHSALNTSLEMFDDLQFSAINRAFNARMASQAFQKMGPEAYAQCRAAALRGMMTAASFDPAISSEALTAAATQAVRNYRNTQVEGLRMSMAREPVPQAAREQCAQRAVDQLAALGYRINPQAAAGSEAERNNQMIAAFVTQSLTHQELSQPLEMFAPLRSRDGLARLGGRLTNQFLTVEPHRQAAFQTVFNGLYAMPFSVPANRPGATHINNAIESAVVGATIAAVYPQLYQGILSRRQTDEQRQAAAHNAERMQAIMANPQPLPAITQPTAAPIPQAPPPEGSVIVPMPEESGSPDIRTTRL